MGETLSDFISRRCAELDRAADELRHKLMVIRDERRQLQKAAEVNGLPLPGAPSITIPLADGKAVTLRAEGLRISERTIKESVMEILREAQRPMKALEILHAINAKFSTDYPRTSLSPQLSRLKADGEIVRDGSLWSLPPPFEVQVLDRVVVEELFDKDQIKGSPEKSGEPSQELGDA